MIPFLQFLSSPSFSSTGDFRYFDGSIADFNYWAEAPRLLTEEEVSSIWVAGVGALALANININNISVNIEASLVNIPTPSYYANSNIVLNNIISTGYSNFSTYIVYGDIDISINSIDLSGFVNNSTYIVYGDSNILINNVVSNGFVDYSTYLVSSSSDIETSKINISSYANSQTYVASCGLDISINNIETNGYVQNITPTIFGNIYVEIGNISTYGNSVVVSPYKLVDSNITISNILVNGYSYIDNPATLNMDRCFNYLLKSVSHWSEDNLANILEANLKYYYDLYMLKLGGWNSILIPTNNIHSIDNSKLRVVDDPNYIIGQVWETPRKDLVWENGIDFRDYEGNVLNPQQVGVPIIDGYTALDWGVGYYIDYPNGKVVFESPFSVSSTVQLDHSYRYVQIYKAEDLPWWQEFQFNSYRTNSTQFDQYGSGTWSLFSENRVQLPAIIIESVAKGTTKGWSLGSNSKLVSRDILFHIYAENKQDRDNIMDIISLRTDIQIWLFDTNKIADEDKFPLNYRGELVNQIIYDNFVSETGYRWNRCKINQSNIINVLQINPNFYQSIVRKTMSVVL